MRSLLRIVQRCAHGSSADLPQRVARHLRQDPGCPVARYLLGCLCFDRGLPALATRQMMIAHHGLPGLESAALLAFTGLAWSLRPGDALPTVLTDTWAEFGRPEFDRTLAERSLFDALDQPPPPGLAPLARRFWRMPLTTLRVQLAETRGAAA